MNLIGEPKKIQIHKSLFDAVLEVWIDSDEQRMFEFGELIEEKLTKPVFCVQLRMVSPGTKTPPCSLHRQDGKGYKS